MKRFISLIVLIATLLCLVSCQSDKEEKQEYIQSIIDKEKEPTKSTSKNTQNTSSQKIEEIPEQIKTVYFDTNGGNNISPKQSYNYFYSFPTPTKNEHVFLGWYADSSLTQKINFPYNSSQDTSTIYAKWLKTKGSTKYDDSKIKNWGDESTSKTYLVTPNGFDLETLQLNEYKMKITVSYNIHYTKDYNIIFDVGYVGAPRYEIYLEDSNGIGTFGEDIKTPSSETTRTISYTYSAADLKSNQIILTFSTDNMQNTIYISDIVATYECYK